MLIPVAIALNGVVERRRLWCGTIGRWLGGRLVPTYAWARGRELWGRGLRCNCSDSDLFLRFWVGRRDTKTDDGRGSDG
jgi:hypothetical protein